MTQSISLPDFDAPETHRRRVCLYATAGVGGEREAELRGKEAVRESER